MNCRHQAQSHQRTGIDIGDRHRKQIASDFDQATGTLAQLQELAAVGWLSGSENAVLTDTMRELRRRRMMRVLLPQTQETAVDTEAAAAVFALRLGSSNAAPETGQAE